MKNSDIRNYFRLSPLDKIQTQSSKLARPTENNPTTSNSKKSKIKKQNINVKHHGVAELNALSILKNTELQNFNSTNVLFDKTKEKEIANHNRSSLGSIVETILFCSHNNLALQGQGVSGAKHEGELSSHEGLFRSLLAFILEAGDNGLKKELETAPTNRLKVSEAVQNEVIDIIGQAIRSKIVQRIKKSNFFSIICDETVDANKVVQLTLCVRYVDVDEYVIREDFLGFIRLKSMTERNITEEILKELKALDLDIAWLRGQGYDGRSNFSCDKTGVQALICAKQPLAFYTHCINHSLLVCISNACEVQDVRNMLGTVSSVINFFVSSAKRMQLLRNEIPKEASWNNLNCWTEENESVYAFAELLPFVIGALDKLKNERDSETSSTATQLISAIEKTEFIISLQVFVNATHRMLSRILQSSGIQISFALKYITDINGLLLKKRQNKSSFHQIFQETKSIAANIGVKLKIPRLCGRQINCINIRSETETTVREYFCENIYYPFLDFMIAFLSSRFKGKFFDIMPLEGLIPAHHTKHTVESIIEAAKIYKQDLNHISETELRQEIITWHMNCENEEIKTAQTALEALHVIKSKQLIFFPNVSILLQLLSTIPGTNGTPERTFSVLKRLKSYLRVNTFETRLNGLALSNVHKEIEIGIDEIVNMFCKVKPNRLTILNL